MRDWHWLALAASLGLLVTAVASRPEAKALSIHTVVSTSCEPYTDWQCLGLYYSFRRARQPGVITRLASCTLEELRGRSIYWVMPTWVTTSVKEIGGDYYPTYLKPHTVATWLKEAQPEEEYILIVDSDMIFRHPLLPGTLGVQPGVAASQNQWYLQDLNRLIAPKLVPDAPLRADDLAAPFAGRRADEVGEWYLLRRTDLEEIAPQWLALSPAVRRFFTVTYPELASQSEWIDGRDYYAEMHAYSLAAAMAGVRHRGSNTTMHQTLRLAEQGTDPALVHYSWEVRLAGADWAFDKRAHGGFSAGMCPNASRGSGLLPQPPGPAALSSQGMERAWDLLGIEAVATLNAAFCALHHRRACPPSAELQRACTQADRLLRSVTVAQGRPGARAGRRARVHRRGSIAQRRPA